MFLSNIIKRYKQLNISRLYYAAVILYLIPLLSLCTFIIDKLFFNKTDMLFWIIFLISPIPCGLLGLVISLIMLIISLKHKRIPNIVAGIIISIPGVISIAFGIFGLLLIYVVVQ